MATSEEAAIVEEEEEYNIMNNKANIDMLFNRNRNLDNNNIEEENDYNVSVEEEEPQKINNSIRPNFFKDNKKIFLKSTANEPKVSTNPHIGISDKPPDNSMKPYQSPVNITVSYITKNSVSDSNFAKDDIVSNSKLGTPGINTGNSNGGRNLNEQLTIDNANRNNNTNNNTNNNNNNNTNNNTNNNRNNNANNNSNCIGPQCNNGPLPIPDQAYTNSGYSYVNTEYQNYNGLDDNTNTTCKNEKCNVCPMEINQNWSKWNPQYLSGDNESNNNQ